MTASLPDTAITDRLDLGIVRALQLAPRVPFRALGDVLGRSEQTVARRYRRLRREGVVRVTAVVSPEALGQSNWMVRAQVRPSGAESLARALAQRDDVSWVTLVSGGSEVVCVVRSRTQQAREDLLIQKLPRTTQVLGLTMSVVLHRFAGASHTEEWSALAPYLDTAQHAALAQWAPPRATARTATATLDGPDAALLDRLVTDGRASYAALGAAAGVSEGRAARRLDALLRSGVAFLDVDVSGSALGFRAAAVLWLTVTPGEIARAGESLAACEEVAFVAAVSGAQNMTASVMCRDLTALYRFVTTDLGPIAGVQALEISPVLRAVKQAGTLNSGDRLLS